MVIAVAVLYFAAAKLGLSLAFMHASVSPVWPPTGLAIAVAWWLGYRVSPGVFLGALLANYFLTDVSTLTAIGIALGNTLEAVTAVYLLRRFVGSRSPFYRVRDVLKFVVLATIFSTAIAATIGNISLCLGGFESWQGFGWLWLTWWSGDAVGALIVAPLILTWLDPPFERWPRRRTIEAVALLLFLTALSATIYTKLVIHTTSPRPWGHIAIPLLLWAAFRFGPRGVSAALALLSGIAIWGTAHGVGGFALHTANENLLFLEAYIANLAITTFCLAAIVIERKQAERDLSGNLAITRILTESPALSDALPRMLQRICRTFDWELGVMWEVDPGANLLRCLEVWPSSQTSEFERICYQRAFSPGTGLPGRVWKNLRPYWIPDVTLDGNFPRGPFAAAEGLHAAFAFPILSGENFLGVMEFFSYEIREPDEALLASFSGIGNQIGQFLERKGFEEERERLLVLEQAARNEAEEANRIKDEFLATLSHELRTPLTAILGWLSMLRTRALDEATAAHGLETIERNARVQAQLIEDLVDVSRIVGGKLRLEVKTVDLLTVIEAAADVVRPAADARGVSIEIIEGPSVGPVSGDPARLQQVIWNLLSNAVRFTPREGYVRVFLRRPGSSAEIVVSDTGAGIRSEFLPYVFERFRQAESPLTRSHHGLGLGLAIVRHLTELHGGTVRAESAGEGQGATFTVWLPLTVVTETQSAEQAQQVGTADPGGSPRVLSGLRVLVVEDEHDARELLSLALQHSGAEVRVAESVQEGLLTLSVFKPDVLLSDIGMPGESGYDLIRKTRSLADWKQIPAVALTAFATDKDRELALEAGFQEHLAKPIDPKHLVDVIRRLVNHRSYSNQL